jgi:hypothetical protein
MTCVFSQLKWFAVNVDEKILDGFVVDFKKR